MELVLHVHEGIHCIHANITPLLFIFCEIVIKPTRKTQTFISLCVTLNNKRVVEGVFFVFKSVLIFYNCNFFYYILCLTFKEAFSFWWVQLKSKNVFSHFNINTIHCNSWQTAEGSDVESTDVKSVIHRSYKAKPKSQFSSVPRFAFEWQGPYMVREGNRNCRSSPPPQACPYLVFGRETMVLSPFWRHRRAIFGLRMELRTPLSPPPLKRLQSRHFSYF